MDIDKYMNNLQTSIINKLNIDEQRLKNFITYSFIIFCIGFILFLILITVFETQITQVLPTDNREILKNISEKYNPHNIIDNVIPKTYGDNNIIILDENEEFDDEKGKYDNGWYD